MKAAAVVIAKRRGTPRNDEARSIIEQLTQSSYGKRLVPEKPMVLRAAWRQIEKGKTSNQRNSRRKDRLWNVQIERTEHMAGRTEKSGEQRVGQNLIAPGNKMRS
jgi:hypothetical protein